MTQLNGLSPLVINYLLSPPPVQVRSNISGIRLALGPCQETKMKFLVGFVMVVWLGMYSTLPKRELHWSLQVNQNVGHLCFLWSLGPSFLGLRSPPACMHQCWYDKSCMTLLYQTLGGLQGFTSCEEVPISLLWGLCMC